MPFQSMNMLQFFMETDAPVGRFVPPGLWKANVASTNMDSTFCRSLLLISAAFFAGHAGGLCDFESAHLHHKLESIRTINMLLSHPETQLKAQCLKLIGTLLLTETYLGYDTAAKHHLTGLMKLLNFRQQQQQQCFPVPVDNQESSEESDVADRYNILAQAIIKATSRLEYSQGSSKRPPLPLFHQSPRDPDRMIESIRLLPYFFVSPSVENNKIVDNTKPINELKFLVSLLNPTLDTSNTQEQGPIGGVALIILNANRLHAESVFKVHLVNEAQEPEKLGCTWQTFIAARYCFWYGVLGLSKLGPPLEVDLSSHLCVLFLEDVDLSISTPAFNQYNPDLWIWIAFSAAVTLKRFWGTLRDHCGLRLVEQLHHTVATQIKIWAESQNIRIWNNVEGALKRIAWPDQEYEDAAMLWYAIIGAGS
ncbi:hypothetical protein DM02DRAFT_689819 [Periconia macrospinosa]|uniref:Transcription factor domain-containing protein n=1 Tax=Periconia macrospinosa TaxID=97972 RepID=A0A2V1E2Y0_9PLEO|nr:hypothetical protein DM02DRAFT_689819 [Periconia macrospinosa]